MKTCSKCKLELPFEQFSKNKSKKDGLRVYCNGCEKKYREENKEAINEHMKKYYEYNKEKIKEQNKKYREDNKEAIYERRKKHREAHKEDIREKNKKYREAHKEDIKEYKKKYSEERRKTDEGYRILECLRSRLRNALKGTNKSASTMELVGCSIEFLRDYLENTKVEGKDYSDAHIDHIRPCASFDLTDPEQQRECFHYTNLQYLPAKENISKGARLEYNI